MKYLYKIIVNSIIRLVEILLGKQRLIIKLKLLISTLHCEIQQSVIKIANPESRGQTRTPR